jgi:hypothetical protein
MAAEQTAFQARLSTFDTAMVVFAAARVFSLEPQLAVSGIVVLITGWPLFQLGRKLFGTRA